MDYKRISPGIRKIYSKTLGEHVYFVPDNLPPEKLRKLDGVAYSNSELLLLRGVSQDDLKAIHMAKKLFNAELVKPEDKGILLDSEDEQRVRPSYY